MKKTFFSMLLVGSSAVIFAQTTPDTTGRGTTNPVSTTTSTTDTSTNSSMNVNNSSNMNSNTNMNSSTNMNNTSTSTNTDATGAATTTGNYNAYGNTSVNVPARFQTSFSTSYPNVGNATWSQVGDFYRASYNTNGRFTHVFYGNNGTSYSLSLPVLHSYVPEEVISKVGSMYGPSVYGIGQIKTAAGQPVYQVHLIENGQSRMEWVGEDGATVQSTDIYRTEEATLDATGTNMNGTMNTGTNTSTTTDMNTTSGSTMNTTDSTQMNNANTTNSSSTTTSDNMSTNNNNSNNNQTDLNNTNNSPAMAPTSEKNTKMKGKTSPDKKTKTKTEENQPKAKEDNNQ